MTALEKPVPEAGEEIHLPGGSIQPLLLTVGITVALVGVTISIVLVIADTRRDIAALPEDHDAH